MIRSFHSPKYYSQRAQFLLDISEGKIQHISEIRACFSNPEYGWIAMDLYVDGIKAVNIAWSDVYDPTTDVRDWLTDIITDKQSLANLFIDEEGSKAILTFEKYGVNMFGGSVEDFNNRIQLGLFSVYETMDDTMPIKAIVSTRQLVSSIYLGLLTYAATFSFDNIYNSFSHNWDFHQCNGNEYYEDVDDESIEFINKAQWTFYNNIKSLELELNLYEKWVYHFDYPENLNLSTKISDYIIMRAECGGRLFSNGKCCGNADSLNIDGVEIDLSDIKGLRQWYDEFDKSTSKDNLTANKWHDWMKRGRKLAFEIRKRLPMHIDLFYYWVPFNYRIKELPDVMDLIPNIQIKDYNPL